MPTLNEFFGALQNWEGQQHRETDTSMASGFA